MKHLVKKYVNAAKVGTDVVDVLNNAPIDEKEIATIATSNMDGFYAMALTEGNHIVQTFKYVEGNNVYLIAEPDPIVIYFDTARHFHKTIDGRRMDLFSKLSAQTHNISGVNGDFYWYFSTVCNYAVFLFLAIEAFVNKAIPNDFEYKKKIQDKKVELYDKQQIQRNIDFTEKVKSILPLTTSKNFVSEFSHKYELIKKLKDFRDEIVHTKSFQGENSPNYYEQLYVTSLNFEFDKVLLAARDFINYHQPNLIEECNCGTAD